MSWEEKQVRVLFFPNKTSIEFEDMSDVVKDISRAEAVKLLQDKSVVISWCYGFFLREIPMECK